jgi:geranylgeranyl reductase family protein
VLVVEKARLPRYKACGGAIPRPTLDRFPFDFDEAIEAAPARVRLTFPDRPPVDVPLPERPVVMVMRGTFDAFLLARSGAEVLEDRAVANVAESPDGVQVDVGHRTLTARYLVGADGAASQVARCLGLRQKRQWGSALEAEVPLEGKGSLCEVYGSRALFALGIVPWGYAWVFPKADHLSVGIGRVRPGRVDLRLALQRGMRGLGIHLDGLKLHGHLLPTYQAPPWPFWGNRAQERLSTRRCLLVGDAAGLMDPLIGEGIRYAIASARLAADAIAREDLSGYEAAIWRQMGHSLATAGLAANTYYRMPRLSYNVGLSNPALVRCLVDVLTERYSYVGIGRRLLATTALWLLRGQRTGAGAEPRAMRGDSSEL